MENEPRPRRSRRTRSNIRIALAPTFRDLEILKLLARYRYLRKHVINAFVGGNSEALTTRLGQLYRAHLVNRPSQQWNFFNANYRPAIYEIDVRGEATLTRSGEMPRPVAVFKHLKSEFAHNLMLCDVLANLEIGAHANGARIEFIHAAVRLPANIQHSFPRGTAVSNDAYCPDAAFTILYDNGRRMHCLLEVDTGSEPLVRKNNLRSSSYLKKLLQLRHILKTRSFGTVGFDHLWVLHVTNSETRRDHIMRLCAQLDPSGRSRSNLFQVHPVLGDYHVANDGFLSDEPSANGYLFGTWVRANCPKFDLVDWESR